jgi:rRNA maturation endonuclease Nob1
MKYCDKCKKEFETDNVICPICGNELQEIEQENNNELEVAEIVSTMMITGII